MSENEDTSSSKLDIESETKFEYADEQSFGSEKKDESSKTSGTATGLPYNTIPVSDERAPDPSEEDRGPDNDSNDGDGTDDERPSDEELDKAEPLPKQKPEAMQRVNRAKFLNRLLIIMIIGGATVALCIIFGVITPALKNKKKAKTEEMDKAGKIYIPDNVTMWQPPKEEKEGLTSEIPDEQKKDKEVAPVSYPQNTKSTGNTQASYISSRPETNRNEQQKDVQRLSLDGGSGGFLGMNKNQSYNSGRAYSYTSGNSDGGNSFTPVSPEDRMKSIASMMPGMTGYSSDSYTSLNNQSDKASFATSNTAGSGQYRWNTEISLYKGTDIPAVLETAINTDLPGQVIARVTSNVYSSKDGKYLLIPEGTTLTANYNSSISYAQSRVQVAWNTMIRSDGLEVNLGNMQGVDAQGMTGYTGHKSEHPFEYAKAMGLIAMFSIIDTKFNNSINTQNNQYAQNALADVYSATSKMNQKILDRAMDIQPTITIKSGTKIHLITNVSMDLPPVDNYPIKQKYVRY